jgi:prepilin-type N-terminal cleavage/methylation domain-containing protein
VAESRRLAPDVVDQQGLTLVELLLVLLFIGILAACAAPLYLGYTRDAKTAEAKLLAESLWTAIRANAMRNCGTALPISASFGTAGLDASGATVPGRWSIGARRGPGVSVDCATGAIGPDGDIFTIVGVAGDIRSIHVTLTYEAGATPPSRLRCSADGGRSFTDC